jgi:hypothetical protein
MPYELGRDLNEAERIRDRTDELMQHIMVTMDERYFGQYYTTVTKASLDTMRAERAEKQRRGVWTEQDETLWKQHQSAARHKSLHRQSRDNPVGLETHERDDMWAVLLGAAMEIKDLANEIVDARSLPMLEEERVDIMRILELRDRILHYADAAGEACRFDNGQVEERGLLRMIQTMAYVSCLGLGIGEHDNYRAFQPLMDESAPLHTIMNHYAGQAARFFAGRYRDNGYDLTP